MRLRRRYFLFRALRKRRQLAPVRLIVEHIQPDDILCFAAIRNEAVRLPYFLEHYRKMGVAQFLIVDNGSDDGSADLLQAQPDVSLWQTSHSYKRARFGIDWITGLQMRFGHGHWCLTVDADELLIIPHQNSRNLHGLTAHLDQHQQPALSALMLEPYPRTRLSEQTYLPGDDPMACLGWFDTNGYRWRYQDQLQNWLVQGGVRERVFFADAPALAPTLSKTPLVKWHWRYAYVSSTHSVLPPRLNQVRAPDIPDTVSGILLHTKFLPMAVQRSAEEQRRQEHFSNSQTYDEYYDALAADPCLWWENATCYQDWRQLQNLGLLSSGNWE